MKLPLPASKSTTNTTRAYRNASGNQVAEDGSHGVYRPIVVLRRSFNRRQEEPQQQSASISAFLISSNQQEDTEEEGQQLGDDDDDSSSSSCSCSSCSACKATKEEEDHGDEEANEGNVNQFEDDGDNKTAGCFNNAGQWVAHNLNSLSGRSKGSYTLEDAEDDYDDGEAVPEPEQDQPAEQQQEEEEQQQTVEETATTTAATSEADLKQAITIESTITIDQVPTAPRDEISVKSAPLLSIKKTGSASSALKLADEDNMKQRDRSATMDLVDTAPKIASETLEDLRSLQIHSISVDDQSLSKRQRREGDFSFIPSSVPVSRPITPERLLEQESVRELGGASSDKWRVVVAIDFGTTYSGYAFAFTNYPSRIYVMRRWQQGDPGLRDHKIPTALLLQPNGKFHSFGFEARNKFHSLDHDQAKHWLYFQNFKTILYAGSDGNRAQLNENTQVEAANGSRVPALTVFAYVLRFFRQHALAEIKAMTDDAASSTPPVALDAVRWVVTVPAIWSQPAKQFMRQASYMAELAGEARPEQLIIALEPEAASVFIRSLRLVDLPPQFPGSGIAERVRPNSPASLAASYYYFSQNCTADIPVDLLLHNRRKRTHKPQAPTSLDDDEDNQLASFEDAGEEPVVCPRETVGHALGIGSRYVVVDCGGGTVDITVHELVSGGIRELYKASGSNHGSLAVNNAFLDLLSLIFNADFLASFRQRRPAGFLDLLAAFESRKRAASPWKMTSLNVALPFNFLDLYQRTYHETVDRALTRLLADPGEANCEPVKQGDVTWSSCGGVLRLYPPVVRRLFEPAIGAVLRDVEHVLEETASCGVDRLFIVGGFAESPMLQHEMRQKFGDRFSVIIPPEPSLAVLRGAVAFGLDPGVVQVRHSQLTYGIGVLHRYDPAKHPRNKRVLRFGTYWCTDVFDKFVTVNQAINEGDIVVRRYSPVSPQQTTAIVKLYACADASAGFLTDPGVYLCGILRLNLAPINGEAAKPAKAKREIQIRMSFGDTEIHCVALDVATQDAVSVTLDFLARPDEQQGAQEQPQAAAGDPGDEGECKRSKNS